jgi:hypothetical protein
MKGSQNIFGSWRNWPKGSSNFACLKHEYHFVAIFLNGNQGGQMSLRKNRPKCSPTHQNECINLTNE